ncbi:hypothetical protein [Aureispira sp. CCB-QB1]|uniref:hypothetical protein n=1 Tax=Aureispira sp. CCB-QB1 TaxID=1313421 RepID=UPI0006991EB4|nr:hypothetical protein [Aureispira sp. CCB-QB1]
MRFLLTINCLFFLSISLINAQGFGSPVEYIEYFNKEFALMQEMQIEYSSFLAHTGSAEAEAKRQSLLASSQKIHDRFASLKAFEDDKGIKSNAVKVLDIMLLLGNNNYTATAIDKAGCLDCFEAVLIETELIDKDVDKLGKAMSSMVKSIEEFAKANNIQMTDEGDNHETLLAKINRINNYLQELNLATLEVQYADAAIVKALNEKNPSKAKEEVKNMVKAANNASKRLKKIERIKEDATAIGQAEKLVDFYKDASKKLYPDMVSAFDKKGNVINEKVDLYNKSIQKLAKSTGTLTMKYETAKLNLQQRHIPKPKEKVIRS